MRKAKIYCTQITLSPYARACQKRGARRKELDKLEVPQETITQFAKMIFPKIKEFYATSEAQEEFERWKNRQ